MASPSVSFRLTIFVAGITVLTPSASAQIGFNGLYSESFDSLPTSTQFQNLDGTWQDNSTLPGWYRSMTSDGTPGVENRWRVSNGAVSGGSLYSFGSYSSADRAFGFVTSSNLPTIQIGARIRNQTGSTVTEFNLSYIGEQWRHAASTSQVLEFSYGVGLSGLSDPNFISHPTFDFHAMHLSGSGTGLDGNSSENRIAIGGLIQGIAWGNGQDLWLRWTGHDQASEDQGLAIDNLVMVVPEPATLFATGTGLALLAGRRRRS